MRDAAKGIPTKSPLSIANRTSTGSSSFAPVYPAKSHDWLACPLEKLTVALILFTLFLPHLFRFSRHSKKAPTRLNFCPAGSVFHAYWRFRVLSILQFRSSRDSRRHPPNTSADDGSGMGSIVRLSITNCSPLP